MNDGFTVADAYLFTVLNWCNLFKLDLSKWPALTDYLGASQHGPRTGGAQGRGLRNNRAATNSTQRASRYP